MTLRMLPNANKIILQLINKERFFFRRSFILITSSPGSLDIQTSPLPLCLVHSSFSFEVQTYLIPFLCHPLLHELRLINIWNIESGLWKELNKTSYKLISCKWTISSKVLYRLITRTFCTCQSVSTTVS